jgi:NADH-quinone oxidoreductase subunit N
MITQYFGFYIAESVASIAAILMLCVFPFIKSVRLHKIVVELTGLFIAGLFYSKTSTATLPLLIVILTVLHYINPQDEKWNKTFEIFPLMLLCVAGCSLIIRAVNPIILYLGIELQSMPIYIMLAIGAKNTLKADVAETTIKYFILGSVASCMIIFGISFIPFMIDGSPLISTLSLILIITGLCFKAGLVPFHLPLPDAYSTSDPRVVAVLSILPKISSVLILLQILYPRMPMQFLTIGVGIFAVISLVVGAVGSIRQNNINRLLAYSGIFNVGFVATILIAAMYSFVDYDIVDGVKSVKDVYYPFGNIGRMAQKGAQFEAASKLVDLYFICYLLSIAPIILFTIFAKTINTDTLNGLFGKNKIAAIALTTALISLIAIPPFAGFLPKMHIIEMLVINFAYNWWILLIIIITSTIITFAYLGIMARIFISTSDNADGVRFNFVAKGFFVILTIFIASCIFWKHLFF